MPSCSVCRPTAGVGRKYFGQQVYVVGFSLPSERLYFTIQGGGTKEYSVRWANLMDMCHAPSFDGSDRPPAGGTTGWLYVSDDWAVAQSPDVDTRGDPKHPAGAGGAVRNLRPVEIGKSYFLVRVEDTSRRFEGRAYWIEDAHLELTDESRFGLRALLTPELFTAPDASAVLRYDGKPVPTTEISEAEFAELQGAPIVVLEYAQDTTITILGAGQGDPVRKRAFIDFSIPSKADPKRQPYFDVAGQSWTPAFIDEKYLASLPAVPPPESAQS